MFNTLFVMVLEVSWPNCWQMRPMLSLGFTSLLGWPDLQLPVTATVIGSQAFQKAGGPPLQQWHAAFQGTPCYVP